MSQDALLSSYQARYDAQTLVGQEQQAAVDAMSDEEFFAAYKRAHQAAHGYAPEDDVPDVQTSALPPKLPVASEDRNTLPRYVGAAGEGVANAMHEIRRTVGQLAEVAAQSKEHPVAMLFGQAMLGFDTQFADPGPMPPLIEDKTLTESLTAGLAQFALPYAGSVKALNATGLFKAAQGSSFLKRLGLEVAKDVTATVPGDFAAFDPHQNNLLDALAGLASKYGFDTELVQFMQSVPEDQTAATALENRVRAAAGNVVPNAALGGTVGPLLTGAVIGGKMLAVKGFMAAAALARSLQQADWALHERNAARELQEVSKFGFRLNDVGGAVVQGAQQVAALTKLVAARMMQGKTFDDVLEGVGARQRRSIIRNAEDSVLSQPLEGQPHRVPFWAEERLRQTLGRSEELGRPLNEGVVVRSAAGEDRLGAPTTRQWKKRVTDQLTEAEILAARRWYNEVHGIFVEVFGPQEADRAMTGWLASNQNVDPAQAMTNMLKIREEFRALAPVIGRTEAGLAEDKLMELFRDGRITEGLGVKLLDFIDSAMGVSRRTAMGGARAGGEPFVIDIHSMRDMGYVDWPMYQHLVDKHGQDAVDAAGVRLDTPPGYATNPTWAAANLGNKKAKLAAVREHLGLTELAESDAKTIVGGQEVLAANEAAYAAGAVTRKAGKIPAPIYETAAERGRELTRALNRQGWLGGGLTPAEVQAIGWTAQARRTGASALDTRASIERNTQRVAFEVDFGKGAPLAAEFPEFKALPFAAKAEVTRVAAEHVASIAEQITGLHMGTRLHGVGGWLADQNPNAQMDVTSTWGAAESFADVVGLISQQTEVMVVQTSPKFSTGKGAVADVSAPGLETPEQAQAFWTALREVAPEIALRYSPTETGIRIVFPPKKGVGEKGLDRWRAAVTGAVQRATQRLGIGAHVEYAVDAGYADVAQRRNDWEVNPDGESYMERLVERYGPEIRRAIRDRYEPEYREILRRAIAAVSPAGIPAK